MIILTVVRHGESTDNLKAIWAGSADATLSVHGMNQAKALGKSLQDYRVDAIFASNLLRATWTAQQIQGHQPDPKPPLTLSPLLQEQHFGKAERQPYAAEAGQKGFHRQPGRDWKFDGGESLNDVRRRAEVAIAKFIEPLIEANVGKSAADAPHIFVVAHGIFNSEFLGALLARRGPDAAKVEWRTGGMTNTGWTRLQVGRADEKSINEDEGAETTVAPSGGAHANGNGSAASSSSSSSSPPTNPAAAAMSGAAADPSSTPAAAPQLDKPATTSVTRGLPKLAVRMLTTNVTTHLEGVKRQQGGIGSMSHDGKQKDIRQFFGGGGAA